MNRKVLFTMFILFTTTLKAFGMKSQLEHDPVALTMIWDTSPSVKSNWDNFTALARQAVMALEPGDYLEVISAHHKDCRLRVSQYISSGNLEEVKTISSLLENISCADFLDADVGGTLEVAYKRLENISVKQHLAKGIVIVLTDGNLTDKQADSIRQTGAKCRQRNWPLYLTGTRKTDRNILIAAGQKELQWSQISQANPMVWLQDVRPWHLMNFESKKQQKKTPSARVPTKDPNELAAEKAVTKITAPEKIEIPQESQEKVQNQPEKIPAAQTIKPPSSIQKEPETTLEPIKDSFGKIDPNSLLPDETLPDKDPATLWNFQNSIVFPELPPVEDPCSIPQAINNVIPIVPEEKERINERTEPNITVAKADIGPTPILETQDIYSPTLWMRIKNGINAAIPWLITLAGLLLAFVVLVGFKGLREARNWRTKIESRLLKKQHPNMPKILIAKLNGRSYRLGELGRFQAIHVGSGTQNTIRIPDKSIGERHLRIYQTNNSLLLRNLAKSSVQVNNLEVRPGRRHKLVFPAVIKLNDNVNLKLKLVGHQEEKDHETKQ